jgi:hypothetical protein
VKVGPVRLDPIGKDLHVIPHLVVPRATRAEEDELSVDEEDDGGEYEVVGGVAKI